VASGLDPQRFMRDRRHCVGDAQSQQPEQQLNRLSVANSQRAASSEQY